MVWFRKLTTYWTNKNRQHIMFCTNISYRKILIDSFDVIAFTHIKMIVPILKMVVI